MASVARTFGRVISLSLQNETSQWYRQGWNNRISLMANRSITRWMYAFATLSNGTGSHQPAEYSTFAGLSFTLAPRVMAAATRGDTWGGQAGKHTATSQAMVQQSLPIGPGLGYRLVLSQGESEINQANVQYQGAYGRLEADYTRSGYDVSEKGRASLTASGGMVLIGGRPFLSRAIQDSYALIRVPGVANVRGTLSNQEIGATNRNGDLLIPNLLHYYGNRVGINDKDIPLDYDIAATERTIAPPFRDGVVVAFPVRRVSSVAGAAVVEDEGVAQGPGTLHALNVGVVTSCAAGENRPTRPGRRWLPWLSLAAVCAGLLLSGAAFADSRSSLVLVTVRVVDSCRVNATGASHGVDVSMRCTSAARPSVRMEDQSAPLASQGSLTGTKPVSSLSLTRTGDQVLRIDF